LCGCSLKKQLDEKDLSRLKPGKGPADEKMAKGNSAIPKIGRIFIRIGEVEYYSYMRSKR
jgi:hypothetical protein